MTIKDVGADGGREDDFPFTEWQLGIERASDRLAGRVRHCARSAFVHLRKAWRLRGVDDEMSAFRALTGKEEAATALIQALKARGYVGADLLEAWSHEHKNAFWLLIEGINDLMAGAAVPPPQVSLSREGPPRITLLVDIAAMAGESEPAGPNRTNH